MRDRSTGRASGDGSARQRIIVFAAMQLVPSIAAIPQVREVNPYRPPSLTNNVATGTIHADALGIHAEMAAAGPAVAADTAGDVALG